MFTLLPPQQKKNLFKQYRLRLFIVMCLFGAAFFVISSGSLFPSKVYLSFAKIDLESEAKTLSTKIKEQNDKGLIATLNSVQSTLQSVTPELTTLLPVLKIVMNRLPQGVSLNSLSYIHGKGAPSSLNIQGVAKDRAGLISFSKDLKSEPIFTSVDLPVSNLAKQEDVKFTLTLIGRF